MSVVAMPVMIVLDMGTPSSDALDDGMAGSRAQKRHSPRSGGRGARRCGMARGGRHPFRFQYGSIGAAGGRARQHWIGLIMPAPVETGWKRKRGDSRIAMPRCGARGASKTAIPAENRGFGHWEVHKPLQIDHETRHR
jgi:hypothetical protein